MVDGLVWYSPTKGELRRYGSGGVAIIDQWIASHAKYFIGKMETCMCITFIVPMGQGYIILFCILVSFPILWPDQFLIYMSLFTSSSVAHSHLLILILYISNFNFLEGHQVLYTHDQHVFNHIYHSNGWTNESTYIHFAASLCM